MSHFIYHNTHDLRQEVLDLDLSREGMDLEGQCGTHSRL